LVVVCLCLAIGTLLVSGGAAKQGGRKVLRGDAVYYADRYGGRRMACGGRYHPHKMVAAHRSLPCGTKLRVRSRVTGKRVIVTVRDRGPYNDAGTILDLSRRAAQRLGYITAGRTRVAAMILN
jgi:rare lipoprotein A